MVPYGQKKRVENISLISVANEFVERVDSSKLVFGQFTNRYLSVITDVAHKHRQ